MRVLKVDTLLVSEYAIRVRPSWGRGGAIAQGTAVWIRQNGQPTPYDTAPTPCPIEDRRPVAPMLSSMTDTLTWLTLSDAAAQLSVSTRTIERRIAAGALRSRYTETGRVMVGIEPTDRPAQAQAVAAVMATAEGSRQAALALSDALPALHAAYEAARSAVEARATAAERNAAGWRVACLTVCASLVAVSGLAVWGITTGRQPSHTLPTTATPELGAQVVAEVAVEGWHPPLNP